ncbi:uncharacterized [Tachysurus ichikawai]
MEPRCQRLAVGRCGLTPRYLPRAAPSRFPFLPQRLPDAHRVELLGVDILHNVSAVVDDAVWDTALTVRLIGAWKALDTTNTT